MRLFYNIGMWLFAGGVQIAALFNAKARLFAQGRRDQFTRLRDAIKASTPIAWFHCASLGEFEQGRPVMEAYRQQYPQHKILLTFFSPSGYEVRKNYDGADWVFYLPIDTPRNARRFLKIVHPHIAIFIKYEFWDNYLRQLKKQAIPTYIVSAIFRPQQVFFKWYGSFFRQMLKCYRYLFVQDEASVKLLKNIGIDNVVLAGDTRFDRVWAYTRHPANLPIVADFAKGHPTLVAGSTWASDEERLYKALEHFPANVRLIIAPHEIHEERLVAIERLFEKFQPVRYTRIMENGKWKMENEKGSHLTSHISYPRVLIIDTMGMLLSIYSYGNVAYVGGGFDVHNGVHNTIEPAAYGLPVIFGPVYKTYAEARQLVANGGGTSVKNSQELTEVLQLLLLNDEEQHRVGQLCAAYVGRNQGATAKVINSIKYQDKRFKE